MEKSETYEFEKARDLFLNIRRIRAAISKNRIAWYKPVGKQRDFHAASTAEVRLVMGGNRSGKTTCGAVEAIAHSLSYRPWLPEDHPDRVVRLANGDPIPVPNVGRIICENFEVNVVQTIMPKILEWAPHGEIKHIQRNQRGVPVRLDFKNGSVIHILSYDQDDRAFEGPNGHWAWFDEPPPQRKFNGIRRGLIDFDGHCWLTMTPLAEPWINEVLVNNANEADGRVRVFYYSIWDNCIDNGGTLSARAINSFLEDLPEDERKAREHGLPLHLAGLVFPEWRPDPPYYIPAFDLPDSWPKVCVIDPHPRKPIAVLWAAMSPDNILYVYRTLFSKHLRTVADVAQRIKDLEGWSQDPGSVFGPTDRREYIALRIIDTSANEVERTSGQTVAEQFAAHGIVCMDAYKRNKDAGINAIREALRVRADWQKPGLVVMKSAPDVKQNFLNFVWERWGTGRQQGLKGEKQEAVKNHDDFIDCIRYIFQMRLNFRMLKSMEKRLYQKIDDDDDGGMPIVYKPRQPLATETPRRKGWTSNGRRYQGTAKRKN